MALAVARLGQVRELVSESPATLAHPSLRERVAPGRHGPHETERHQSLHNSRDPRLRQAAEPCEVGRIGISPQPLSAQPEQNLENLVERRHVRVSGCFVHLDPAVLPTPSVIRSRCGPERELVLTAEPHTG
ncbi:MAG: hypothetical protein M3253_08210, partial [Chloroflexota bacterium]|nr:hypothetical protein [Chloroflexota bacterium]